MKIRRLLREDALLIKDFSCGDSYFDNFLKSHHALDDGIGTTYIALQDDNTVIGFYNITAGSVDYMEHGLRIKDSGSIHINYFAVDKQFQKKIEAEIPGTSQKIYTSDLLLNDCRNRIKQIRKDYLGISYITLNSSAAGINLYERNGFFLIDDDDDVIISPSKKEVSSVPMYLFLDEE